MSDASLFLGIDLGTTNAGTTWVAAPSTPRFSRRAMVDGLSLDVPLDRDRLRALTQPLVDRSIAVCQRLLKQQRGRERAFHVVYETLSSYGVWLFNRRRQRVLGNRVFRFLMIEACLVRDDAACRLQAHNTCIGC